jgi:ubiquinone/menaquinone biosynthesis C-methylase UbiE
MEEVEVAAAPAGGAPQQYNTKTATEFWDGQAAAYESRPFCTETGGYFRWCLDLALQHLAATAASRIVDLGAGTGNFSHALHTALQTRHPVVCVDPSAGLLELARERQGLRPIVAGAFEFIVNHGNEEEQHQFDRVLMKEMVHFISRDQWPTMWPALYARLAPGGRVVIMLRPQRTEFPFSRGMVATWEKLWGCQGMEEAIEAAGFELQSYEAKYPLSMTKREWLTLLASRFWSNLAEEHLPADQLASDLEELKASLPEGELSWNDTLTILVCVKPDM